MNEFDVAIQAVISNANQHRNHRGWEMGNEHLESVLYEEVGELTLALHGKHEHVPELEMIEIAGYLINWLRHCDPDVVLAALATTTADHSPRTEAKP